MIKVGRTMVFAVVMTLTVMRFVRFVLIAFAFAFAFALLQFLLKQRIILRRWCCLRCEGQASQAEKEQQLDPHDELVTAGGVIECEARLWKGMCCIYP